MYLVVVFTGEVRALYRSFKQECPNGIVNEETFKEVYEKIFPLGDASRYAHLVFSAIDRYRDFQLLFINCGVAQQLNTFKNA